MILRRTQPYDPLCERCLKLTRVTPAVVAFQLAPDVTIDAGVLKKFNAEYRTRRIRAKQRNESFMSYSEALSKLRAVLAKSVAAGGTIPPSFIAAVFDAKDPKGPETPAHSARRLRNRAAVAAGALAAAAGTSPGPLALR